VVGVVAVVGVSWWWGSPRVCSRFCVLRVCLPARGSRWWWGCRARGRGSVRGFARGGFAYLPGAVRLTTAGVPVVRSVLTAPRVVRKCAFRVSGGVFKRVLVIYFSFGSHHGVHKAVRYVRLALCVCGPQPAKSY